MSFVVAALLGIALGVVTGMPLGVINVAIVDAAAAGHRRTAIGIGIGGAAADAIHAALAFVGIGTLVTARPDIVRILAVIAAALVITYAFLAWRSAPQRSRVERGPSRAIATGFVLTLPNPGALTAWVAVASLWPVATPAHAIVLAAGVGLGSAAWFTLLARLVAKLPADHRALRVIPKAALVALLALAVVGVVRAL